MPIKRNLTNTSMTERIMTWFKSLFFKRKPKYAYVEPEIIQPKNGRIEYLTHQEIIDKYGAFLSEDAIKELEKVSNPPEFVDTPDNLMISDYLNSKNK
jgi:hypothetical protein